MPDATNDLALQGAALRRARALSAPTRVELLAHLQEADGPLTAADLAAMLGIHHTAVRQHLVLLVAADLVHPQPMPVVGRGRPRTGYVAGAVAGDTAYRELAGMLADAVRSKISAREAGRAAGRSVPQLAKGPVATLQREAQRLGFRPECHDDGHTHEVVLRACPFADLAAAQPETICELHLGLAEGIADGSGTVTVGRMIYREPAAGGCRIVLHDTVLDDTVPDDTVPAP